MKLAYDSDPELKARLIAEMREHREAERLVRGTYWEKANGGFKGCAVGCLTKDASGGHAKYETEWGIPVQSLVWPRFTVWLLADPDQGVIRFAQTDRVRNLITDVARLYERVIAGEQVGDDEFAEAAGAAGAARAAGATEAAWAAWAAEAAWAAWAAGAAGATGATGATLQAEKLIELLEQAPVPAGVQA